MDLNFYKKEKAICNFLLKGTIFDSNQELVSSFCPSEDHYSIKMDGEISIIDILEKKCSDQYSLNLDSKSSDFLLEVIIILEILQSEKILYSKVLSKCEQFSINIESSSLFKEGIKCSLVTNIQSDLLYNFLTSQIYVDKYNLKKFIKHKYKTENEIKESRDNKLYFIAITAIIVPLIMTVI